MGVVAGRVGYEHGYRFSIDDQIVPHFNYELHPGCKTYLIEFRSSFIVKTINGEDQIIDSERYGWDIHEERQLNVVVDGVMDYRLGEYWMTEGEIDRLEYEAVNFTNQAVAADQRYAICRVIPLAIDIEVRTVQQQGESIGGAMDRAIKAVDLAPMAFWDMERESYNPAVTIEVMDLRRYRMGDSNAEVLPRMDMCDICFKGPRIGAEMSVMDCCDNVFHTTCLVQWMLHLPYCPACKNIPNLSPFCFFTRK